VQFHVSAAELDVRGSGPSVGRVELGRVGLDHKILRLRRVRLDRVQFQKYLINMQFIYKKFVDYNS